MTHLLTFAAFLGLVFLGAPAASQPALVVSDAGEAAGGPPGSTQARAVVVDRVELRRAALTGRPVVIEAGGRVFEATAVRSAVRANGVSWSGVTADEARVTLTMEQGHLVARLVEKDGLLMIEPVDGGHVAYRPGPYPEHEDDVERVEPDAGPWIARPPDALFPDELHLMVVYTPALAAVLGAGLPAFLQATEDVVNDVLQNSLVPFSARLVHSLELTYNESGNMSTDLSRLRAPSDGFMDEVHAARDAYSADLVALIVQNAGANCGVAYLMDPIRPEFHTSGFSVTLRSCAIGNLTFPHELGHNIGLRHDRFVDDSETPFTYSHGFVNDDSLNVPPGRAGLRTTLAYNNQCTSQGGTCVRVPFLSSPDLTFAGQVLGDSVLAHNARAAAFALPTVAEFRAAILLAEDDGDTAGASMWRRPECPDPGELATCVLGDSARWIARMVQTSSVGLHHLRVEASHDAVVLLYEGGFDPLDPLADLVGYSVPDTTAPANRRLLLSHALDSDVPYTVVVTGREMGEAGPFDLAVYGPPGGGIVVPGADAPLGSDEYELAHPSPNPFVYSTTITLVVRDAQRVQAELFDALGRRVAIVHDAALAAGAVMPLHVDGGHLAPGAYILRVTGETFQATRGVMRIAE